MQISDGGRDSNAARCHTSSTRVVSHPQHQLSSLSCPRALAQRHLHPLMWHQRLFIIISVELDMPSSDRPASQRESGGEGHVAGVCRQLSLLLKARPVSPLPMSPGVSLGAATGGTVKIELRDPSRRPGRGRCLRDAGSAALPSAAGQDGAPHTHSTTWWTDCHS